VRDDRTSCIEACGTGKTLLALWLTENRRPSRVLVLVPSLALLAQTRREWLHEREIDFNHLCVCSDPTVEGSQDEPVTYASDCNFRVSTSPDEVRRFLEFETDRPKVVFCTYQSSPVIAAAMSESDIWDLGIFDEAHRTAGRAERSFILALQDTDDIRIKKRVFFTATPRHCNPLHRDANDEAVEVYSMDDRSQYGDQAYKLTFKRAIDLDVICPYKVLVPVFTTAEVNDWLRRHGKVLIRPESQGADYVKACQVANQLALVDAIEKFQITKIFTFHSSINSARSFASGGPEGIASHLKGFECYTINSKMRTSERTEILEQVRYASKVVLSNARCLTEGVNLPAVDCVALLSPQRSRINIAQAIGRVMRKAAG
jgi:predicted helicase